MTAALHFRPPSGACTLSGRPPSPRRRLLLAGGATLATAFVTTPLLASSRRALPQMTDGPFYPPRPWRMQWPDWDADLTHVEQAAGARSEPARGSHLGLQLVLADTAGRLIDGAEVEIWQCDTLAHYRHPDVPRRASAFDPGFQGFGAASSSARGEATFRTIRPVAYPGRTPHIHVKLRHPSFGEWTSQLFVAGDPGNARDFLWRQLNDAGRQGLALQLQPAPAAAAGTPGAGLSFVARHELIVPA